MYDRSVTAKLQKDEEKGLKRQAERLDASLQMTQPEDMKGHEQDNKAIADLQLEVSKVKMALRVVEKENMRLRKNYETIQGLMKTQRETNETLLTMISRQNDIQQLTSGKQEDKECQTDDYFNEELHDGMTETTDLIMHARCKRYHWL